MIDLSSIAHAIGSFLHMPALDYTLRNVALGSVILGVFAGALGSFAVLRKQSLLGDAMSHAALPGVALAFMLTLSKDPLFLLLGAIGAGWIGTLFMLGIIKNTIIKEDAALGIILSVFFGIGIVLLTFIQRMPDASKAGLSSFLFGNASTLIQKDVILMAGLGLICLIGLVAFWKEFKILSFDEGFAKSLNIPVNKIDILLTSLIVIAIAIGLQTVGVVLMSAMIIAPASAARQWTDRLAVMVILAALFGGIAGLGGAILSSQVSKLPTGPTIVVIISIIVIISLLVAPNRGMIWEMRRQIRNKREINIMSLMSTFYRLSESHKDHAHPHDYSSLVFTKKSNMKRSLVEVIKLGWVTKIGDKYALTKRGYQESKRIAQMEE